MNEITIDMSHYDSPESAHKLLPIKIPDPFSLNPLASALSDINNESTADSQACSTSQAEFRFQILPTLLPALVYSDEILSHLRSREEKLGLHCEIPIPCISPELRAKMVDWIIEVVYKAECTPQTLFLAVGIMDRFLKNAGQTTYKASDMHIIGVVAMLLASKFEDVAGMDIPFMYEQVVHKKISVSEMLKFELQMLEGINFTVSVPTELDFLALYTEQLSDFHAINYVTQTQHLATLNLHCSKLTGIRPSLRAACTLLLVIKNTSLTVDETARLIQRLCITSFSTEAQINAVSGIIEDHKTNFRGLYPKLKNAATYVPAGFS